MAARGGSAGVDRSALGPGQVSAGPSTPESEPELTTPRVPALSAPVVLGDPASQRQPLYDEWVNCGRRHTIGSTTYEPRIGDVFLTTIVSHNDTQNNHVRVPQGARVKFPSTSRTAVGGWTPFHLVLWSKPRGTDRLDDLTRDYVGELREAMERIGGFKPEEIDAQCAAVDKSGDAAIPPRPAPVREAVDL